MEPDFHAGDLVLINPNVVAVEGDVIVARHPFKNVDIIKSITSIDSDGYAVVDSPAGDGSGQFGRVPLHTIKGVVTYNWRADRNL